jgi:3-hydroxy-9,10-secoandrosta-1,3,5(10)-triene-9,17-dione monooxygenase
MAQNPAAQLAAADAALAIDAMKLELFQSFDSMMSKLRCGEPLKIDDRIHYRYQSALAAERCCEQVSRLFHSCGAQGIFLANPIARFFADIHAARAHYANHPDRYGRNYGAVLLGQENTDLFI